MKLQLVYRAVLTRYNFKVPFSQYTWDQDHEFDEQDLLEFVERCNNDGEGGYRTEIEIRKCYKVSK